jgi:hypothetical protein
VEQLTIPNWFAGELQEKQVSLFTGCSAAHYWKCDEIMWELRTDCKSES